MNSLPKIVASAVLAGVPACSRLIASARPKPFADRCSIRLPLWAGCEAAGLKLKTILAVAAMTMLAMLNTPVHAAGLEQGFAQPPWTAQPLTWWHWLNGNITKEGITADLESMRRVGIGGAQIFNVANKAAVNIPAGPVKYLSPECLALLHHAASEADRLGLKLTIHNSAGWSGSGGPWVTPENSMKKVVWSESAIAAGNASGIVLPQPPAERDFYPDIAVLASSTG